MALKRFMLKSKAESTQQIFPVFLMVLPEISGQKKERWIVHHSLRLTVKVRFY